MDATLLSFSVSCSSRLMSSKIGILIGKVAALLNAAVFVKPHQALLSAQTHQAGFEPQQGTAQKDL
jgi:hypothetical protein